MTDSEDTNQETLINHEKTLRSPLSELQNQDNQAAPWNNQDNTDDQNKTTVTSKTMNVSDEESATTVKENDLPLWMEPPPMIEDDDLEGTKIDVSSQNISKYLSTRL